MKKTAAIAAALLVTAVAALHLPGRPRLELYDVQDLVYMMDGPGVDISLATDPPLDPIVEVSLTMTGMDLADQHRLLVPGSSEDDVCFQNGLLIVRATPFQHAAIRGALVAHRARNSAVYWAIDRLTNAKAALSAGLFGMITK